ncbi:MAG: L-rhamnonate dehydratase [Armatimonadetes bacterium]|nr:L-rhamnonate dehydratase [Armatimonadota bacterium]
MKIQSIQAVRLKLPDQPTTTPARRAGWAATAEVANPMSGYPAVKRHRSLWTPRWEAVYCKVTAENGAWGLGMTSHGRPVAAVVEDHLAPQLVGQDCLAIGRLYDMMFRLTKPYGSTGLASYAVSAVDLALWDLKGKLLGQPVYSLLGGPARDRQFCYVTGNDVDWYQELGYRAFKLACPYGPADGVDGLARNEALVGAARDRIGPDAELMLDCWMALDVEYTVRLAERLRPHRLRWLEECLIPEDLDSHEELRRRLPWQSLSTGEHWYTPVPFAWAAAHRVADILQPDINWCGGVSACLQIVAAAQAAGLEVILHGGGNTPYGQHFTYAMPGMDWLETFVGSPPGVPLKEAARLPGQAIPDRGWLVPSDAPGFGLEVEESWLEPFFPAS